MHVSNETGAVNDIQKLVKLTRKRAPKAIFTRTGCKRSENQSEFASTRRRFVHYIRTQNSRSEGNRCVVCQKGVSIKPLIYGGGQEKGFRSGTENVPSILGFEQAVKICFDNFDNDYSQKLNFREQLTAKLTQSIEDLVVLSPSENFAPNILTVAFKDVRGEVLLHDIEDCGILVGIGSACSSHRESRFKGLLGLDERHKDGIIRFSTSYENKVEDIDLS